MVSGFLLGWELRMGFGSSEAGQEKAMDGDGGMPLVELGLNWDVIVVCEQGWMARFGG